MTVIRELLAKIGFEVDSKNLDKFDNSINQLKTNLTGLQSKAKLALVAITAATGAINAMALSTAKAIKTTNELSSQIGVSADDLRTLEFAAQEAGLKTDALTNSMLRFSTILGMAKISVRGTNNEFTALGINIQNANGQSKDTITLYREAALKLNSMKDPARKAAISYRLFGTANVELTKFLTQSNEALTEQLNAVRDLTFALDEDAINSSKKFIKTWTDAKIIFTSIKDEISLQFMPILDEMLGGFKDWFILNKEIIKQNIERTVSGIATTFKFLYNTVKVILTPITKLVEMVGGLENALRIVAATIAIKFIPKVLLATTALRGLSFATILSSTGLLATAIGGLGTVLLAFVADDLANWVEGNESATGKVLGEWKKFKADFSNIMSKGFEQIGYQLKLIWDPAKQALIDLGNVGQFVFDFFLIFLTKSIPDAINGVIDGVNRIGDALTGSFTSGFNKAKQFITGAKDSAAEAIYSRSPILKALVGSEGQGYTIRGRDDISLTDVIGDDLKQGAKEIKNGFLKIRERNRNQEAKFIYDTKKAIYNKIPAAEALLGEPILKIEDIANRSKNDKPINGQSYSPVIPIMADNSNLVARQLEDMKDRGFNPLPITNTIANNSKSSVNNVTQNISQNMTITVPAGTSEQQSQAISHQVASEVSRQFETVFLNGINSIPAR